MMVHTLDKQRIRESGRAERRCVSFVTGLEAEQCYYLLWGAKSIGLPTCNICKPRGKQVILRNVFIAIKSCTMSALSAGTLTGDRQPSCEVSQSFKRMSVQIRVLIMDMVWTLSPGISCMSMTIKAFLDPLFSDLSCTVFQ